MKPTQIIFALSATILFLYSGASSASAAYTELSIPADENIQNSLYPTFPTGLITPPNNSFGAPFYIPANVDNFDVIDGTVTIDVPDLIGVTDVYTLMNAYYPRGGDIATVEFVGSAGATQTYTLVDGTDIRDEYQGSYLNTINGTTTQNAYTFVNPSSSFQGTYVSDEQDFSIDSTIQDQGLVAVEITQLSCYSGEPLLLAATASTDPDPQAVPEPSQEALMGVVLLGAVMFFRRMKGLSLTPALC
jgi:hypothetical protein